MFQKYSGIIGIFSILLILYLFSNNKKIINYKTIVFGLLFQFLIGIFILEVPLGKYIFHVIAKGVTTILEISRAGGNFVFGFLNNQDLLYKEFGKGNEFIFAFQIVPTIIFICALVSLLYYFGILQNIIKLFAWVFNKFMGVSGAEALANTSVAIVGQVESAIVIQPYLPRLTRSELLTIMTGGMACISGSLMAIYSSLGIKTEYLLAASFMAIPGSFVTSKLLYPEDKKPVTENTINIDYDPKEKSLIEAILDGATNGAKISIGIIAMLIAFISLVALVDKILINLNHDLSLKTILGFIFTPLIQLLGVPKEEVSIVAQLFGTKISLNEFIAYLDLSKFISLGKLSEKSIAIATFILCGFANFGSIAIQVGGLAQMAPERKSDLASLGMKALVCGTLTSCISGCIAGFLV
ncbi:MAG: hypothetical protein A3B68_01760 [Candidatus Melainabacteria bacterium RIFCSPHIGHO2_02_FULL_34_12]|nr:MAG: hypothetical protein A3B68_01760 [Candidatus Melainabacteria bacterium RIFCSPHIGHO2_02_FULL_34_12]